MTQARRIAVCALLVVGVTTAGCRDHEQSRPLDFEPHVYYGDKLPSLTEQQKRNLQERGNLQR